MQSLNEELQSSNEELQSSNEELETTNEELQSTNEELQTAYAELKVAYDERAQQQQRLEELSNDLAKSNKLLKEAERIGGKGSFRWSIKDGSMDWSNGVYYLFGLADTYSPTYEAFIGLAHGDDRKALEAYLDKLLTRQEAEPLEFRAQRKDSQTVWLRLDATVFYDSHKQVNEVMGTLNDISSQVKANMNAASGQRAIEMLVSTSLSGMMGYDLVTQKLSFLNPAFTSMLGYQAVDIGNSSQFWAIFHPDDVEFVQQHFDSLTELQPGELKAASYRIKHKETQKYVRFYASDMLFSESFGEEKNRVIVSSLLTAENSDLNYHFYKTILEKDQNA